MEAAEIEKLLTEQTGLPDAEMRARLTEALEAIAEAALQGRLPASGDAGPPVPGDPQPDCPEPAGPPASDG